MSTPVQKFKIHLQSTLDDIKGHLKNDREFDLYELKINTAMSINPRDSIKWFMECLEPYADQILSGNDSFFLNAEINDDMDEEYRVIINKVKQIWKNLDNDDSNSIKRDFKLILMLGAIAVQNENLRLIINKYRDKSNPLIY